MSVRTPGASPPQTPSKPFSEAKIPGQTLRRGICYQEYESVKVAVDSVSLLNRSSTLPEKDVLDSVTAWFPRMHSLVIGPGLGRDPVVLSRVKKLIMMAKEMQKHIVIDADGVYLVTNEPEVVSGYDKAILTPNGGEFPRLYEKMFGKQVKNQSIEENEEETKSLASKMGGVTILRKGAIDVISNGVKVIRCEEKGCMRRCGGQGDVLAGLAGVYSFWAAEKENRLSSDFGLPPTMVAAFGACFMTKKCAEAAFAKYQRSMVTQDLVDTIGTTFDEHLEHKTA